ncbi:MAG: transposase [Eubacteriales bacterium]|nr:transposase [Eubacteriales bacterium]
MGKKDVIQKIFWEDNRRFADFINVVMFRGEQIISAKDIEDSDASEYMLSEDSRTKMEGYRDIVRKVSADAGFALIGIEDQTEIHYAMPLRVLIWDAMCYDEQLRGIARMHAEKKDLTGAEYLSRFAKTDRVLPMYTFVLYYGSEPWDGARNVTELIDDRFFTGVRSDGKMLPPFSYPIHLIEIQKYQETGFFQSDLREVFEFIQRARDKNALKDLLKTRTEKYEHMSVDAVRFIATVTRTKELERIIEKPEVSGKKGETNMCKAIDDMIAEGRAESEEKARKLEKRLKAVEEQNRQSEQKAHQSEEKLQWLEKKNQVVLTLLAQNRNEDIVAALQDDGICRKLIEELGIGA